MHKNKVSSMNRILIITLLISFVIIFFLGLFIGVYKFFPYSELNDITLSLHWITRILRCNVQRDMTDFFDSVVLDMTNEDSPRHVIASPGDEGFDIQTMPGGS